MNDLENTVKKLCESFEKFRSESQPKVVEKTFADIAAGNVGTGSRYRGSGNGNIPTLQVTEPPYNGSWADEMEGRQLGGQSVQQGGHLGRGQGHLGHGQHVGTSVSPKRGKDGSEVGGQR